MALEINPVLFARWTVREWHMVVRDVIEEMNLAFVERQAGRDGVHGRVAPTLVEKATVAVEGVEVINVRVRAQPVEVPDLEVGPEVAVVVGVAAVITQEAHRVVVGDVLRVRLDELLHALPQRGDRLDVLVQAEHEAVLLAVLRHELERVVADVAVELDARLHTPVPFVLHHQWVSEEEAGFVATHVAIAD